MRLSPPYQNITFAVRELALKSTIVGSHNLTPLLSYCYDFACLVAFDPPVPFGDFRLALEGHPKFVCWRLYLPGSC